VPHEPGPFDLLDRRFRLMSSGTRPLCLPGDLLGGAYLGRAVPLVEVREALLRRGTAFRTRDAVMAELVGRARTGEPWGTGLAGVLLPGLRAVVGRLARAHPWHAADLEAETLRGLLEAVQTVRLDRGRIAASLVWAARRHADRSLACELREVDALIPRRRPWNLRADTRDQASAAEEFWLCDHDDGPAARDGVAVLADPRNPETVLEEACRAGVLSAWEADVIGATRVARVPAREYAQELGESLGSMRLRRYRAEQRLVEWLATR
jgi:hypothetical protein